VIARPIAPDPVDLPRRRRLGQRELDLKPWTSELALAGGCGLEAVDDRPIDGAWDALLAEPRGLGRCTAPWIHNAQVADLGAPLYPSPTPDPPAGPWSAGEQFAAGAVESGTILGTRGGRRAREPSRASRTRRHPFLPREAGRGLLHGDALVSRRVDRLFLRRVSLSPRAPFVLCRPRAVACAARRPLPPVWPIGSTGCGSAIGGGVRSTMESR
jgi:hypothetical protein